jgi:hypothetical protein
MPPPPLPEPEEKPNLDGLDKRSRLLGCALAGFLLLPLLFCLPVPLFWVYHGDVIWWLNRVPFDSDEWKEAEPDARYAMAWDLRAGLLRGKTQEEVVELLGQPMTRKAGGENPGETWYYDLGGEKYQFQFDHPSDAVLAVHFVEGRVVKVWKATW